MANERLAFRTALGVVVGVTVVTVTLVDPNFTWFIAPAVVGGALVAAVLFRIHRSQRFDQLEHATDGPETGGSVMFNLSSVKPSGIGGLGLTVMAMLAALNYRQGQFLVAAGLIGGLGIAALLARYHRSHSDDRMIHLRP